MSFTMFTLEQEGQKSGGAMPPPSLKSGGATGPLAPPVPPPMSTNGVVVDSPGKKRVWDILKV